MFENEVYFSNRISNEWLYALRIEAGGASQTKSLQSSSVDGLISVKLGHKGRGG